MGRDDDIIVAGVDDVEPTNNHQRRAKRCGDCGSELEWELTLDCIQRRMCPECDQ